MTEFDLGSALLVLARSAIAEQLGLDPLDTAHHVRLEQPSATFVTLKQAGGLRGCVGSLHAIRPLRDDVRANAVGAAFRDPRFAPLAAGEFARTSLEVSLLSADVRIEFRSEADLLAQLRPGIDGVTLEYGRHRATLLPLVWERLEHPRDFLAALKVKAQLPEDFWSTGILISRYAATTWKEPEPVLVAELH
jgi:AmmeMemoRadiSam system protein A